MPASSPYNPYFGTGLLPLMSPEHAATALATSSIPQAMTIATNPGAHQQKRNVQVRLKFLKLFSRHGGDFEILFEICSTTTHIRHKRSLLLFVAQTF